MKALIFYRDLSEHGQPVREFLREFERRTGKLPIEVDPDSADGRAKAELYDIIEYPSILATDNEGRMLHVWRGLPLPTISEISYYVE